MLQSASIKGDYAMKNDESNEHKKIKTSLKEYYRNYYNGEFFRDFRYIWDGLKLENNRTLCFDGIIRYNHVVTAKKHNPKNDGERIALNFLTSQNHLGHYGLMGGEITYFKSHEEYSLGDITARWSDRQFFDIDIESEKVDSIKSKIKNSLVDFHEGKSSKRELKKTIRQYKADFRDLIFNQDLLYPTFQEAKKLCLFLEDMGLHPYLICSGMKGFHINIFYEECRLQNLSQVSRLFAKTFSEKLDLNCLDYAVFDRKKAQRRLQRIQYLFHSKTEIPTIPIPDLYDYDEFMSTLRKKSRRPLEFDFDEYSQSSGAFRESLIYNDKQFSILNQRRERELKKANEEKRRMMKKKYGKDYRNYSDISMVDLYSAYGGQIIKEDSEKAICRCLFHGADRNPSAVIFKNSNYFHCSSCGKTLNYYAFISEMEGTDDHSEIMAKVDEFMK